MNNEQSPQGIVEEVVASLRREGVSVQIAGAAPDAQTADAVFILETGDSRREFAVEVKSPLTRAGALALGDKAAPGDRIVIAPEISAPLGEELRALGINFADTAGNAYIRAKGLLISISGRRLARSSKPRSPADRAFRPAGLRVVFTLLSQPGTVTAPYRDLAKASAVSLGSIPPILQSLETLGYLAEIRGERKLLNRHKLAEEWVEGYRRSKLHRDNLGVFAAPMTAAWWKNTSHEIEQSLWGGEVAAGILGASLIPSTVEIYGEALPTELLARLKARRDPAGAITVRKRFWRFQDPFERSSGVVPPLLIYADLLGNGDARSLDAAKDIYDRYIAQSLVD
jgi:hypothetical protein